MIIRVCLSLLLCGLLMACTVTRTSSTPPFKTVTRSVRVTSELDQGQRDFDTGYYRRAMHHLLPLAYEGVDQAQYAVGYLYYYGYGVAQDTEVAYFWIEKAAAQGFAPAQAALVRMTRTPVNERTRANLR